MLPDRRMRDELHALRDKTNDLELKIDRVTLLANVHIILSIDSDSMSNMPNKASIVGN